MVLAVTPRAAVISLLLGFVCSSCERASEREGRDAGAELTDTSFGPSDAGEVAPDGSESSDAATAQSDSGAPAGCLEAIVTVGQMEIFAYEASDSEGRACSRQGVTPWTGLTRAEAESACASSGFALCSDAQWLAACAGESGRSWPYGGGHIPGRCNDQVSGNSALALTGSFPGCVTPEGVFDLSGNVWEMTADGQRRGASFRVNAVMFDTEITRCDRPFFLSDVFYADDLGFRCCRAR